MPYESLNASPTNNKSTATFGNTFFISCPFVIICLQRYEKGVYQ